MKASRNILFLFPALLVSSLTLGQFPSHLIFVTGKFEPMNEQNAIDFRCDSIFNLLLNNRSLDQIDIFQPPKTDFDYTLYRSNSWAQNYFEVDTLGNQQLYTNENEGNFKLNTQYWKSKLTSNRLISLGNPQIKKSQLKKVEWLQFYPCFGNIESIRQYQNLKYLSIPYSYRIPYFHGKNGLSGNLGHFSNHGTSASIFETIQQLPNLEYLSLKAHDMISRPYPFFGNRSDLLLIDGIPDKTLSHPTLKMLEISGINLLPVNFHNYEKFEYLRIEVEETYPELINLALVMNHFKKDTNEGNWIKYLSYAKLDTPFSIPETGLYETYYANGTPLCKGEFINGQPHGVWEFWYSDGRLCEKREYKNGLKVGNWILMEEPRKSFTNGIADTSQIFTYTNDQLIERRDKQITYYPPPHITCHDHYNFHRLHSLQESTFKFSHQPSGTKTIQRSFICTTIKIDSAGYSNLSDTVNSFCENWHILDSTWNYHFENNFEMCTDQNSFFEYETSGKLGEIANYSLLIEKENRIKKNHFQYVTSTEIDFRSGKIISMYDKYDSQNGTLQILDSTEHFIDDILRIGYYGPKK